MSDGEPVLPRFIREVGCVDDMVTTFRILPAAAWRAASLDSWFLPYHLVSLYLRLPDDVSQVSVSPIAYNGFFGKLHSFRGVNQ